MVLLQWRRCDDVSLQWRCCGDGVVTMELFTAIMLLQWRCCGGNGVVTNSVVVTMASLRC